MRFYKEKCGDYLCVDETTAPYYRALGQPDVREGRATAIAGQLRSVCTTGISTSFLRRCKRVKEQEVPQEWHEAMLG